MESTEEEFSSFTTKGRRTKRQRSLLAATASSSYHGSGGGGGDGGAVVVLASTRGGDNCSDNNSYGSSSSGASPSDEHDIMSEVTTTEEEDMANCLILLAQGIERKVSHIIKSKTKINNNNNNTSTTSTSNISTYECKTCNKTFPSFQALGGHRTSHKKIKPSTPTVVVPPARSPDTIDTVLHDRDRSLDDLDVAEFTSKKYFLVQSNNNNDASKARVHECSICGSEFPSGQALGGHMRRHRAAATTTTTTTTIATSPISTTTAATAAAAAAATTTTVIDTGGPRNILSLDLNLPAPDDQDEQQHNIEVADHMDTKFVHVLPTPTPLVDCHY